MSKLKMLGLLALLGCAEPYSPLPPTAVLQPSFAQGLPPYTQRYEIMLLGGRGILDCGNGQRTAVKNNAVAECTYTKHGEYKAVLSSRNNQGSVADTAFVLVEDPPPKLETRIVPSSDGFLARLQARDNDSRLELRISYRGQNTGKTVDTNQGSLEISVKRGTQGYVFFEATDRAGNTSRDSLPIEFKGGKRDSYK